MISICCHIISLKHCMAFAKTPKRRKLADLRAPQQVPQHFDGARAHGSLGLSSRRQILLLAPHRMALTRERKNPSRIAREIEIFTIVAWLLPTLVPKHISRFRVFRRTICLSRWSINIYETFRWQKIAVSLCNVVFCALLRNRFKFKDVALRLSLALDHQSLHRGKH